MHLFLRVSDTLTNLLILDLRRMDGIEKIKGNEFKQQAATNLNTYIKFLNESCKIPIHMYVHGQRVKNFEMEKFDRPRKTKAIQVDKNT